MTRIAAQRFLSIRKLLGWSIFFAIAMAAPTQAQTPISYAVTYLELRVSSAPAGREILRAYARSSSKENGNILFEALQESSRQSRFVILEAWRGRGALDQHYNNLNTLKILSRLSEMGTAPDDRRIYEGLFTGLPIDRPSSGLVYVMTHVDVMPPYKDACAALLKVMRTGSLQDRGNIAYNVLRQDHEPNHFTIAEIWANRKNLDAHIGALHTVSFRQKLLPMTGALYDERVFVKLK
jgi:quinol monooxygenase YgiN